MKVTLLNNLLIRWKNFAKQYNVVWKSSFLCWDLPPSISADFALTLALPIAYKTKRNPQEVACELLKSTDYFDLESTITNQGYINFRFLTSYYQNFLLETFQQEGKNLSGEKKNVRINIEYVSTNPTGYLHLAHFRHAVLGNTLANIYQFSGYEVVREYYINDQGGQITALINSVYYFYQQLQGVVYSEPTKIEYAGQSSQEVARELSQKWGDKYIHQPLNKEAKELWKKEILTIILRQIQQDLVQCGIKFNKWFSETSLYQGNQHLKLLEQLQEKNLIYQQDGATFFRSSWGGDDKDRVIIKRDGAYTYFFSDILYHQNKLQRTDRAIYIWGSDHHGFLARLKSVHQLLGYQSETLQIILVQMVNLLTPGGQTERFSKRLGNTIELKETLQYLAINQLRFFLLEKEINQPLFINPKLLKENQEKTRLYYLQYAHARCQQIFQKAQEKGIAKIGSNIDLLKEPEERKIFNLLIRFPFLLENIVEENKPHHLIYYLSELAKVWQIYYQKSIILNPEKLALTSQKLLLVKNIQIVLKIGLNLMGIEAPKRM